MSTLDQPQACQLALKKKKVYLTLPQVINQLLLQKKVINQLYIYIIHIIIIISSLHQKEKQHMLTCTMPEHIHTCLDFLFSSSWRKLTREKRENATLSICLFIYASACYLCSTFILPFFMARKVVCLSKEPTAIQIYIRATLPCMHLLDLFQVHFSRKARDTARTDSMQH